MPTVDFDAAWAEATGHRDQVSIRAFGEDVLLPDELPAKVVLLEERNRTRRDERTLALGDVLEVLEVFVGRRRIDAWLDQGMGIEKAVTLTKACRGAYLVRELTEAAQPGPDAEGEAGPGPDQSGSGTSSTAGSPSKPTSPASTSAT